MTEPNELTKAKGIEVELAGKLEAARESLAEMEDRRAALSYDAHVQGGDAAKALAKVNAERATIQSRVEELNHAIKQARERVSEAAGVDRRVREDHNKDKAREVLEERFLARGEAIDRAFAAIRETRQGMKDDLSELRRLGAPAPGDQLVEVNLRRAFDAAAAGAGLSGVSPVPPLQRHSVAELVAGWSRPIAAWIATRLVPTSKSNAA